MLKNVGAPSCLIKSMACRRHTRKGHENQSERAMQHRQPSFNYLTLILLAFVPFSFSSGKLIFRAW